jgi:hypothetical protein
MLKDFKPEVIPTTVVIIPNFPIVIITLFRLVATSIALSI